MNKLRTIDLIAPVGGLVLLISTFLGWFDYPNPAYIELSKSLENGFASVEFSEPAVLQATAWNMTFTRYVIYLAAIAGIALFLMTVMSATPAASIVSTTPVLWIGTLASLAIAYRWIDVPIDGATVRAPLYLGLGAAVTVMVGAFVTMRDEHVPAGFAQAPEPVAYTVGDDASVTRVAAGPVFAGESKPPPAA